MRQSDVKVLSNLPSASLGATQLELAMKDFAIRFLLSALVASLVSAAILYFAFDQALRGVETAISGTNSAIHQNGEWIRSLDGKIENLSQKISDQSREMDRGFSGMTSNMAEGRSAANLAFLSATRYSRELGMTLNTSLGTTAEILAAFRKSLPTNDPEMVPIAAQIDILVRQLNEQRQALENLNRTNQLLLNDSSTDPQLIRQ